MGSKALWWCCCSIVACDFMEGVSRKEVGSHCSGESSNPCPSFDIMPDTLSVSSKPRSV
jgi:hypothetical protein